MEQSYTPNKFENHVVQLPAWPAPGIRFYDISPLLGNGPVFAELIETMSDPLQGEATKIIGFDARGFIFGAAMAAHLGIGFAMLRKAGKLPGEKHTLDYDLEYGSNSMEIQTNAVRAEDKVVLVDDVIATGGTALAGIELVSRCGAEIIEFCSVIDLPALGGSKKIREQGVEVRSQISYTVAA